MTTQRDKVLIAVINSRQDMEIACKQHWYRIPVKSVEKFLKSCWVPEWIAFYQTKVFGEEAYAINYYAYVNQIQKVYRWELFPDEPENEKTQNRYYKLEFSDLKRLSRSIVSDRYRRITFISTTLTQLETAVEINDLLTKRS